MKTQTTKYILMLPVTTIAVIFWIVMLKDAFGTSATIYEYLLNPSVERIGFVIGYCAPIYIFTWWAKWCWTPEKTNQIIKNTEIEL